MLESHHLSLPDCLPTCIPLDLKSHRGKQIESPETPAAVSRSREIGLLSQGEMGGAKGCLGERQAIPRYLHKPTGASNGWRWAKRRTRTRITSHTRWMNRVTDNVLPYFGSFVSPNRFCVFRNIFHYKIQMYSQLNATTVTRSVMAAVLQTCTLTKYCLILLLLTLLFLFGHSYK